MSSRRRKSIKSSTFFFKDSSANFSESSSPREGEEAASLAGSDLPDCGVAPGARINPKQKTKKQANVNHLPNMVAPFCTSFDFETSLQRAPHTQHGLDGLSHSSRVCQLSG